MSVSIAAAVRITTKSSAVWRDCNGCGSLAPLAPAEQHCRPCRQSSRSRRTGRNRSK
ncbi:hypothetical protein [Micromonospora carbonacea]|uniref:hypothetical protein n=1 Tax=Micromonospora carbonacea TaxID=47853 RepID=UPI0037230DA4